MGNLSNLYVSRSFQSLIHLATDNTASVNLIGLEDGYGNPIGVSVNTAGDLSISGSFTASLQQGYVWVGNGSGKTTTVATSSFGGGGDTSGLVTTASFNAYTSSNNQRVSSLETNSASVNISITNVNSATASLFTSVNNLNQATSSLFTSTSLSLTTASVSGTTMTFTKGNGTTFNVTLPTGSGGGSSFPYTGDAQISGSLGVTGSLSTLPITLSVAATTASIDMTVGNTFVLNIPTGSTTHIIPTNIIAGQTINLLLKQAAGATTGSVAWSPLVLFPSGYDLVATSTGSAIDLVSMISFDTTNLMAANVKNLK